MTVNYLVYTIGGVVSYLNNAIIYCGITNNKLKPKLLYFLSLITMGIINAYVTIHLPIAVKPIYNFLCLILSIYLIKRETLKSLLYYVFIIWIFGVLLDILFMSLFSLALNKLLALYPEWGILFISLGLQIILFFLFKIKKIRKFVNKLKEKIDAIHNSVILYVLIMFLIILFGVFAFKNMSSLSRVFLFTLLLISCIMVTLYFIKIRHDELTFKKTIFNLLENNNYYISENTKNRVFRHNIIHKLNSIKSVGDKSVNKLINDIIKENKISSINVDADLLPNGINGIISNIIYNRNTKDFNMVISNCLYSNLLDVLSPRKYNKLCEMLGVCLENAIGACEKTKEKILQIMILEDDSNVTINITNTFNSKLEVDKIGSLNYTTKNKGHGLGLYSLFEKRNVIVKSSIVNDLFKTKLIIKKIKISKN